MPSCKQCNNSFPNRITIDDKVKNLSSRKYCLDCSPFGSGNNKVLGKVPKPRQTKGTYRHVKKRREKIRELSVEYKGGKCILCGYNKCGRALSFHHLDPSQKSFTIATNLNKSWDTIKAELDKCVLLCSNCHMEIEDGLTELG